MFLGHDIFSGVEGELVDYWSEWSLPCSFLKSFSQFIHPLAYASLSISTVQEGKVNTELAEDLQVAAVALKNKGASSMWLCSS